MATATPREPGDSSAADITVPPGGDHGADVPQALVTLAAWSWRIVVITAAAAVLVSVLVRLSVVVLPLLIALTLSTVAVPVATWLRQRGVPRALAATLVIGGGMGLLVGFGFLIGPPFVDQVQDLTPTIRAGFDTAVDFVASLPFVEADSLGELLDQARTTLSGSSSQVVSLAAGGIAFAGQLVAGVALAIVLLFFMIKDGDDMQAWVLERLPRQRREVIGAIGERAWTALSGYMRGTAAIALIDAVAIGIGLAILGVPLVLPLSLLVFLGAFLPVIGAAIAGSVAVLVALASGGLQTAVLALLVVIGVQQLEGNVLQPMIMRRAVALHPLVVLVALAVGATLAGIVGAFLSLPLTAVASAIGNELRTRSEGRNVEGLAGLSPAPDGS